jgi:pyruvate dehydrogenase E2 component (dihydrolipoamide acetyltransferase)
MDHTMEKELTMAKLRPEMGKGVLCAWLKEEGDTVAAGEPLFEIETDKVVNQIEATESGVLKKQLAEEGDTVDVAAPVAILETK